MSIFATNIYFPRVYFHFRIRNAYQNNTKIDTHFARSDSTSLPFRYSRRAPKIDTPSIYFLSTRAGPPVPFPARSGKSGEIRRRIPNRRPRLGHPQKTGPRSLPEEACAGPPVPFPARSGKSGNSGEGLPEHGPGRASGLDSASPLIHGRRRKGE